MYPYYGMLDLMDAKERHGNDCTYFMKVENQKSADYASGIFYTSSQMKWSYTYFQYHTKRDKHYWKNTVWTMGTA